LIEIVEVTMIKILAWLNALPLGPLGCVEESDAPVAEADGAHLLETINAIGGIYGIEFIHH
jgi:hypothetical protein